MLRKKKVSRFLVIFLVLIVTCIAAACASDSTDGGVGNGVNNEPSSQDNSAENSPGSEDVTDEGQQPIVQEKPLVLYANDFTEEIGDLFFEKTGYEVEVVHGGGGEVLARIEAERGNPQWDIVWIDGHGSIQGLADRGVFYEGFQPANLDYLNEYGQEYLPDSLAYFPTGVHAAGIIAYNSNILDENEAPNTWEEVMNYDGPIGMADPAVAAPAYPLVSYWFNTLGLDAAQDLFTTRFDKGLHVYPKNGPVGQALVSGEIHVAALQEHNAYGLQLAGEPVELIWPEEGAPGSLRVAAISKETDNLEIAKIFINFLLDPDTQNELTKIDDTDSFFTPLAINTQARPERKENPNIILPSAAWSAENEAFIKQWFADRAIQ